MPGLDGLRALAVVAVLLYHAGLASVPGGFLGVEVFVARAWETPNNEIIYAGVGRHPNAELIDWYSASAGRPELFVSDGVHLQPPGQRLYAAMIRDRVEAD